MVDIEQYFAVSSLNQISLSEIESCSGAWRPVVLLRWAEVSPAPVASKGADAYYWISPTLWPCDL